jgi:hypothetical protein
MEAFFSQLAEAVARQQENDGLGMKLAKRYLPDQGFCSIG